MHPVIKASSLLVLLVAGLPVAASAKADRDMQACRAIADRDARLACYDRLVDEAQRDFGGKKAERDPQRDFGATGAMVPQEVRDAEITNITSKITQVQYDRYTGWTMALDTGAVWTQSERTTTGRDPKVGASMEIRKGPLGSYIAKIDGGRPFRVKRVR